MFKRFAKSCLSSFIALAIGCSTTVIPHKVTPLVASWDGAVQNSGFIGFAPDGGGYITPHALERYNGLIGVYGKRFMPALEASAGVTVATNNYHIDAEHLSKFATMDRWKREGK